MGNEIVRIGPRTDGKPAIADGDANSLIQPSFPSRRMNYGGLRSRIDALPFSTGVAGTAGNSGSALEAVGQVQRYIPSLGPI